MPLKNLFLLPGDPDPGPGSGKNPGSGSSPVLVPDHGEECGYVLGQVDVQQEVVLHLVQKLEALPVPRVVEALQHLAQLRLQLQEQLYTNKKCPRTRTQSGSLGRYHIIPGPVQVRYRYLPHDLQIQGEAVGSKNIPTLPTLYIYTCGRFKKPTLNCEEEMTSLKSSVLSKVARAVRPP